MFLKVLHTLLIYVIVYVFAFDDIYVNGEIPSEIIEKGRSQYQLLKERGTLPQYGNCWKSAVQDLEDGCRYLSEDTQSEIALSLTNCFLIMSGHDPYNCINDKKANVRAICINQMSDRAFNVYTEFYTHTQNICWFLRGQIWQETLSENTYKLNKQLELSAQNQENLLNQQRESLERQEKILKNGRLLEQVLEDLYISTRTHQEILGILSKTLANLQSWVIGEISWFDSIIFYIMSGFGCCLLTSVQRTAHARLPILLILFFNIITERLICIFLLNNNSLIDTGFIYEDIRNYIWYCRYLITMIIVIYIIISAYNYQDLIVENYKYLKLINEQNSMILNNLEKLQIRLQPNLSNDQIEFDHENSFNTTTNGYHKPPNIEYSNYLNNNSSSLTKYLRKSPNPYFLRSNSRQNTPDIN